MAEIKITFAGLTQQGDRDYNEDFYGECELAQSEGYAFVLCDGLGGHGNGDIASRHVCEKILEAVGEGKELGDCFTIAQESLLQKQIELNAGNSMKTTAVCLLIRDGKAFWGHVGDSRAYRFDKGKYTERTLDHSVPQMLVSRGMIREKDIRHHEDRSRLLRVMGTEWDRPKYQLGEEAPVTADTTFLLCSDGFWELIDEKAMCKCLKGAKTPEEWLSKMEAIVKKNGRNVNMDNYTAVAVFCR